MRGARARAGVLARALVLELALVVALGAACGRSDARPRCPECGMVLRGPARWRAGLTARDGTRRVFDTPRCLLRWARSPAGRGASAAWVTDYYAQRRLDARRAVFVQGSDVLGPMGPDFVPVADEAAAQRFAEDHGASAILRFDEATSAAAR